MPCASGHGRTWSWAIGLGAPAPALFVDMPWSTSAVCAETLAHARAGGGRIAILPRWFDVDRVADLARLGREPAAGAYRPRRTLAFLAELTA